MSTEVSGESGRRVFLSAEWRDLVMLNYEVDPGLLRGYVPPGTELDSFDGRTYVSLVGFRFLRTKIYGRFAIPFHANFDEVNLRFYVRRIENGELRRGVVFIREIVPRAAISLIARLAYGENYTSLPMRHDVNLAADGGKASYAWRVNGDWCAMEARVSGPGAHAREGSVEQFITEHYWGYAKRRAGGSLEYRVEHEPWRVWTSREAGFRGNAVSLYGPALGAIIRRPPDSAFVADGSSVLVLAGANLQ
jgi:uncharacterized protein